MPIVSPYRPTRDPIRGTRAQREKLDRQKPLLVGVRVQRSPKPPASEKAEIPMDTNMHRRTVQLTGARRDFTGKLGQYVVEKGQIKLLGTVHDLLHWEHHIEVNFQGFPLGDPRIEETEAAIAKTHRDEAAAAAGEPHGESHIQQEQLPVAHGQTDVHGDVAQGGAGTAETAAGGAGHDAGPAGTADADAPNGNGQSAQLKSNKTTLPEPGTPNPKLVAAIGKLNDSDDTHWTREGKPAIESVTKILGQAGITRAMIEAASPRRRATA